MPGTHAEHAAYNATRRGAWHVEVTLAARRPSASSALQSPGPAHPASKLYRDRGWKQLIPRAERHVLAGSQASRVQLSLGAAAVHARRTRRAAAVTQHHQQGYRSEVTVGQSLAERVARDLHMLGSPGPAATGSGSGGQYQLETQTPGDPRSPDRLRAS
eukprot:3844989-Rhodomonas_salina.2